MTGAALAFDPAMHVYTRPDGSRVPSVTQVLRAVGVSVDFEGLKASSSRLAERIDYRRDLGTAVHADAHAFDDGDLVWESVHPDVRPYLDAWLVFRTASGLEPLTRERRVYDPALGVCGTLDGIFRRPETATRALIDIKIGDPEDAGARYQLAGYQLLWEREHPDQPIDERWSVQLTPELAIPYRITKYPDWRDGAVFRALVTTYYAQAARRAKR